MINLYADKILSRHPYVTNLLNI